MIIRLGYVAISKSIKESTSTPYSYTTWVQEKDQEKLEKIIISNLEALYQTLIYNDKNHIHFYRISSNIIPLATHPNVSFDYLEKFLPYYKKITSILQKSKIRVDFHPNQYCVLNSVKKEVITSAINILEYHYQLLKILDIQDKIILLHIGSNAFGKTNSLSRFIHTFENLPNHLKEIIAIENDDKVFNIEDCLFLAKKLNIPVVLDYHHHQCNPTSKELFTYLNDIFLTWKRKGMTPKIHFSSPKNKREYRAHNDYIDTNSFIQFLNILKQKNQDVDIMLETKAKDDALFRLVRELKYHENYLFLDETSFKIE